MPKLLCKLKQIKNGNNKAAIQKIKKNEIDRINENSRGLQSLLKCKKCFYFIKAYF